MTCARFLNPRFVLLVLVGCGSAQSSSTPAAPASPPAQAPAGNESAETPLSGADVLALLTAAANREVGAEQVDSDMARRISAAMVAGQQAAEMTFATNRIGRDGVMEFGPMANPDREAVLFEYPPSCPDFYTRDGRALSQLERWKDELANHRAGEAPDAAVQEQVTIVEAAIAELREDVASGRAVDVSIVCPDDDGYFDVGMSYVIRANAGGSPRFAFWTKTTTGSASTDPLSSPLFPLRPVPNPPGE